MQQANINGSNKTFLPLSLLVKEAKVEELLPYCETSSPKGLPFKTNQLFPLYVSNDKHPICQHGSGTPNSNSSNSRYKILNNCTQQIRLGLAKIRLHGQFIMPNIAHKQSGAPLGTNSFVDAGISSTKYNEQIRTGSM